MGNKLANCRGVEIFRTGNWRGNPYTHSDLDRMVDNFSKYSTGKRPLLRPQSVIGHEGEAQSLLQNTGLFSVGEVKKLWREGDYLKADVANVPKFMANLINGRAYNGVSAEIYRVPPEGLPNAEGPILRRIAFMGGDIPHIKGLEELPQCDYESYSELLPPSRAKLNAPGLFSGPGGVLIFFSEVQKMADKDALIEKIHNLSDDEIAKLSDYIDNGLEVDAGKMDDEGDDLYHDEDAVEETPDEPVEDHSEPDGDEVAVPEKKPVDKFAEVLSMNSAISKQLKSVQADILAAKQEAKKQKIDAFCERYACTKIPAYELDETNPKVRSIRQQLMAANDTDIVVTFSENGKNIGKTDLDLQMETILARPDNFANEKIKVTGAKKLVSTDELKAIVDSFAEQHPDVIEKTTGDKESFVALFSKKENFNEFKNVIAPAVDFTVQG